VLITPAEPIVSPSLDKANFRDPKNREVIPPAHQPPAVPRACRIPAYGSSQFEVCSSHPLLALTTSHHQCHGLKVISALSALDKPTFRDATSSSSTPPSQSRVQIPTLIWESLGVKVEAAVGISRPACLLLWFNFFMQRHDSLRYIARLLYVVSPIESLAYYTYSSVTSFTSGACPEAGSHGVCNS
jgi:hypothetical protein